jgi:Rrf2 family protein
MKLLSDAAEYGLRAVVWLAETPTSSAKVREISEAVRAPAGYLIKVLQALAKAGIVTAQRGSSGGFRLERNPSQLTVLEVINAIDPMERIRTCPLGLKSHGEQLCSMHRQIDDAMASIEATFQRSTIMDLLNAPGPSRPLRESGPTCCSHENIYPGGSSHERFRTPAATASQSITTTQP